MSSGNFDLTTYYAKRIIGDAAAATAANALLQTGDGITSNIWILHRTNRTTKKYGIHYAYDGTNGHDKIEFYGNDNATAWVQLDTGDASFNNIILEGLTASRAVVTDSNKKLVSVDLSVTDANASTNDTTTFVQAVTQSATGKITVTKAALNTSGTWSGTASIASTVTTTADTTNTLYLVGVTSGATSTLKRDTSITIKGGNINTGTWNATTIAVGKGGTGLTSYTKGDILYASASTTLTTLGIGTAGYVLYATENGPRWYDKIVLTSTDCTISVPITCTEAIYSQKQIVMKLTNVDTSATNNGVSSDVERNFMAQDKNGKNYAFHGSIAKADGTVVASFGVKNYDINNNAQYSWKGITVYQAKGGTVGYTVSATPAFRTAIGLGSTANDQYKFLMSNGTSDPVWRAAFNISSGDTIPELADESDLDEITDPSTYCVRSSTHMKTILHNPQGEDASSGGRIVTMGGYTNTANAYQWQFVFMSGGAPIFRNRSSNTSWNSWRTFVTHPTREAIGDTTTPVYVNANGFIQKCTVGAEGYPLVGTGTNSSPVWYSGLTATGTQASDWVVSIKGTTAISTSNYTTGALVVSGGASFASAIIVNGWVRTFGDNGWYSQTHGGGICMRDNTYVRMYGNKQFLITSGITPSATNLSSQLIVSSLGHGTAADSLGSTSGGTVAIELWRGSNASWQISNNAGTLYFKNNWTTALQSTYTQTAMTIAYNTGNTTISGELTVNNLIKSTYNSNTVTIGSQNANWCHIYNSADVPFIFNKSVQVVGKANLGGTSYPWGNIYIGGADNGIYFVGTKNNYRMIRFIDNTDDVYGNGISIGGGGVTILGSGESSDTLITNLSLTGGAETTYIASDGNIEFYPSQQSYDVSAHFTMTDGRFWAGVNGNTTRETSVGAQSGAGQIYMWSHAATSGSRGIYVPAHGTGAAKTVLGVDTNNNVTFYGAVDLNDELTVYARIKRKKAGTSGWAYTPFSVYDNAGTNFAHFGVYGSADIMSYIYIGANSYDSNNLRITPEGKVTLFSQLTISGTTTGGVAAGTTNPKITFVEGASTQPVHLIYTDQDSYRAPAGLKVVGGTSATPAWLEVEGNIYSGGIISASSYILAGTYLQATNHIYMNGGSLQVRYNNTWYEAVKNHNNGNVTLNAASGTLYMGYQTTSSLNFMNGKATMDSSGHLTQVNNGASWTKWQNTTTGVIISMWSDTTYQGIYSYSYWNGSANASGAGWILYRGTDSYVHTSFRLYGAVWNDYAEYRECDKLAPGTCVQEHNNGHLTQSDRRLIPGASIISDTFGFAEGQTEKADTPIAVSGRVLARTYRDRYEYHAGQAVCSAPNGTVDIMSRDEIMMYPDAIVGIVSEIPEYEEWGTDHIKVNNRIWIKVK